MDLLHWTLFYLELFIHGTFFWNFCTIILITANFCFLWPFQVYWIIQFIESCKSQFWKYIWIVIWYIRSQLLINHYVKTINLFYLNLLKLRTSERLHSKVKNMHANEKFDFHFNVSTCYSSFNFFFIDALGSCKTSTQEKFLSYSSEMAHFSKTLCKKSMLKMIEILLKKLITSCNISIYKCGNSP